MLASAPFEPAQARLQIMTATEAEQLRAIGLAPLADRVDHLPAVPSSAVEPLAEAPARPANLPRLAPGATLAPILTLRLRGRIGDRLYDSLLAAGLSPATAADYLRTLAAQPGIGGDVGPDDHFDLVLAARPPGGGGALQGALLYAAIDRVGASDIRVMKWPVGSAARWVDAGAADRPVAAFAWPVAGRITSGFGIRHHPIFGFARKHRGIDIAARWGQPIVAATDGRVVGAGWAGGYGRQVRIAHEGGLVSSYSHMSRTAVAPGSFVRAGQVIGYVGSSGLSTGPHLHYEVHRGGVAINPAGVRFAGRPRIEPGDATRFRARLTEYMALRPQA